MWAPYLWQFWWICPLIGLLMFLVCLFVASRFAGSGRGWMCGCGHHGIASERASQQPVDSGRSH